MVGHSPAKSGPCGNWTRGRAGREAAEAVCRCGAWSQVYQVEGGLGWAPTSPRRQEGLPIRGSGHLPGMEAEVQQSTEEQGGTLLSFPNPHCPRQPGHSVPLSPPHPDLEISRLWCGKCEKELAGLTGLLG